MEAIHPKVKERIENAYSYCFNRASGNAKYVLDNFQYNEDVRKELFVVVKNYLKDEYELEMDNNDLMFIFERVLSLFILEKRKKSRAIDTIGNQQNEIDMLRKIEANQRWLNFMYFMNTITK